MRTIYNIEVYSLPLAEECRYWYDVWDQYELVLKDSGYEIKNLFYRIENPIESGDEFDNALHLVRKKDICHKLTPVLRKVPL